MSYEKPAIMLVHGAWHVPGHYAAFIKQLENAGFEVVCPLLPTCDGSKRLTANLFSDVEEVRREVTSLVTRSREVVMLLHSYGGAVGAEAVKGLSIHERATGGQSGGIIRLIYMCGFMLQEGESVGGASLPRPVPDPVELDNETRTTFLCEDPVQLFYADLDPVLAKEMEALLVRQSASAMVDQVTYAPWRHIPTTYLRATKDNILFLEWQDRQIKAVRDAGVDVTIETYDSSHSLFSSVPEKMIGAIKRAVQ
ncbi:MAG: hypothetical protein M1821_007193 [Bathelium mastoideum]|nr:MAG: hypothetical protein M1821_007193 [Bathelium mastoideum]KAI9694700.1 MAG: hypothetical protein M1822_000316 [Bathelium mastoideum]